MGNLLIEEPAEIINPEDVKKHEALGLIVKLMRKIPKFHKKW